MKKLRPLSLWNLINMSAGFWGVIIGFALQAGNMSRILSSLGSKVENLSFFWLVGPLTGVIIQPIIGNLSDRTWSLLGRRIPFILSGAILYSMGLFLIPNAEHFKVISPLFFGAFMFLIADISFNVVIEPSRALVGDMVPENQRNLGFSIQTLLINIGTVIGSLLPFLVTWLGASNVPAPGNKITASVAISYYIGGALLLFGAVWTTLKIKEYPPSQYGHSMRKRKKPPSLKEIYQNIPSKMWRLGIAQFFAWFGMFLTWIYTTPAVAQSIWHTSTDDATSAAYNDAANWVGVIFASYSVFAAIFSIFMARLANNIGRKKLYMISLVIGGLGLISMLFIHDKYLLFLPMIAFGVAWASLNALPFAILSSIFPADKMGVYFGIFNATITVPQIVCGLSGALIIRLFHGQAIYMMGVAGVSIVIGGLCTLFVKEEKKRNTVRLRESVRLLRTDQVEEVVHA